MNILSLFDGMSCGRIALNKLDINISNYYSSEVDKHAIEVADYNHPMDTINRLGDVRFIDASKLEQIDLLIGGSPCTSFSFAGKRNGMSTNDDIEIHTLDHYLELKEQGFEFNGQSYLFWEYMRLLDETKPKYFLLENVKMTKHWQDILSKAIGVEPIAINSSLVSAQNRHRLYWTNIPNISELVDLKLNLDSVVDINTKLPYINKISRDIVEQEVVVRKHKVDIEALKVLIKSHKGNKTIKEIATDLNVKKTTVDHWFRSDKCFSIPEPDIWLVLRKYLDIDDDSFDVSIMEFEVKPGVFDMATRIYNINGKAPTLTASVSKIKYKNELGNSDVLSRQDYEQLQTVPVGYTNCVSEYQAKKMLGNGWTVDVIKHIFSHMVN